MPGTETQVFCRPQTTRNELFDFFVSAEDADNFIISPDDVRILRNIQMFIPASPNENQNEGLIGMIFGKKVYIGEQTSAVFNRFIDDNEILRIHKRCNKIDMDRPLGWG